MAQTTSSSGSRTKRNSSSGKRRRSSATTRRSTASKSRNSTRSRNGSSATSRTVVAELAAKAKPQAEKVKRVKAPLLAGGAALAGLAGGVALRSRTESRRPVKKLRTRSLPKSIRSIDLSKVDLQAITEMGRKVRAIGEQVGDVADAAEKTRKKHK
jgi:hypothetical protein